MDIQDIFQKEITRPINGVVKADQTEHETVFVELDEYIITDELKGHIESFFKYYMPSVYDPKQASITGKSGIWVSGFFGSGKSHFIKILSYLLENRITQHQGQERNAFDFFTEKLQDEPMLVGDIEKAIQKHNKVILFNIDSQANTGDKEDAILKVFLKVFNKQLGYSGDHAHIAHLERELDAKGKLKAFHEAFAQITGETWFDQRVAYDFYRDDMAQALAQATGQAESSAMQWVERLESNFSLDIQSFCKWVSEYLEQDADRRLLFFVDEVGQFIGHNTKMMLKLQTITENLGTQCGGKAWIVVTSQEDIDAVLGNMQGSKTQDFSKIQGRFERISLSSSQTHEVIEKRLLTKHEEANTHLQSVYEMQGDIIRSQVSFDQTSQTEWANYTHADHFCRSYPFVPYQFKLMQKVLTGISNAGASGHHMSKGERSLMDAFQVAAKAYKEQQTDCLIPFHSFYEAIQKFLDSTVTRDINQARDLSDVNDFTISVLQTLFMIRYVDELKSTLDHIVILCIHEIDQDKQALRRKIEHSLQVLERHVLISCKSGEYIFLTNEEKELEKEIKNTQVEVSDENKELSSLIFEHALKGQTKYRYPENKQDFPLARFCNSEPFGSRIDSDVPLNIISPLDMSYQDYTAESCCRDSQEQIIIKIHDESAFFTELRHWIQTDKYLRKHHAQDPTKAQYQQAKSKENHERRRILIQSIERLLKEADFYALGTVFDAKGSTVQQMFDSACCYMIENTFSKMKWVKPFAGNIVQETQHTLIQNDAASAGLDLTQEQVNPQAIEEVEKYIALSDDYGRSVVAADLCQHFSRSPYGWHTDEVMLILARLGLANRIKFQSQQQDVALKSVYEHLSKTQKRAQLRIRKIKQQSEANLRKANQILKDLGFYTVALSEKELFNGMIADDNSKVKQRVQQLKSFQAKASSGAYPGAMELEQGLELFAPLLSLKTSYQFIEQILDKEQELFDFAAVFETLEHFYELQFALWQKLKQTLEIDIVANQGFLNDDDAAVTALAQLQAIAQDPQPYSKIRQIRPLIETLTQANTQRIEQERAQAAQRLGVTQHNIENLLRQAHAPESLGLQALESIHQQQQTLATQDSIAQIRLIASNADHALEQAEAVINSWIAKQNQAQNQEPKHNTPSESKATTQVAPTQATDQGAVDTPTQQIHRVMKQVKAIHAMEVYRSVSQSPYIETEQDIHDYVSALRQELTQAVQSNHKVRIK